MFILGKVYVLFKFIFWSVVNIKFIMLFKILYYKFGVFVCVYCLYGVFYICFVVRVWWESFFVYYYFYGYDNFLGVDFREVIV